MRADRFSTGGILIILKALESEQDPFFATARRSLKLHLEWVTTFMGDRLREGIRCPKIQKEFA